MSSTLIRTPYYRHHSSLTFSPFFFYGYGDHRDLHSFPTRRSSDLSIRIPCRCCASPRSSTTISGSSSGLRPCSRSLRSEEHTSELQSQFHLVCRLLLEKKKTELGPR